MNNLVALNQDQTITTTSKVIADCFGKEHRSVMRSIKSTKETYEELVSAGAVDGDVGVPIFMNSSYISEQNKELPSYTLNRDAFNLVAMGFTGSKVMQYKLMFIGAFNKMEEIIKTSNQLNQNLLSSDAVQQADLKAQMKEIQLREQRMEISNALEIAKMCGTSFDINEYMDGSNVSMPSQDVLKLKMAMGKQIDTYGTLSLPNTTISWLLEEHDIDMSAKNFNELLVELGLLTTNRVITAKGLHFGTNREKSANSPETEPRWFKDRFTELLGYVRTELNITI
ncbi:Rha family transcriptional regulator [Vibrio agarivorans]|uniref:Rha family transcriptional regulator n=1 Tax=Vibrio agarivorans TaxID=153622 RepID=UPI00222F237F|nr:Rha family transcriptional regulator [Vibrio agarivorans]